MATHQQYPYSHRLGGGAFNHSTDNSAEQEYDRLRKLARDEHDKRSSCFDRAHQAHERGDGQAAAALSDEGKRHGAMMEQYNQQASDFIFRENNAEGRVAADTIDLHGLYVEEAENIVEARIKYAQQHGQTHLHVIVGKGNHSRDHVQKLKPRVEEVCRQLGLDYKTEENAGRIYVNLTGAPAVIPEVQHPYHGGGGGQQHHQGGHGGGGGHQQHQQHQQHSQEEEIIGNILKRLIKSCCSVM